MWDRILRSPGETASAEAARALLRLRFPPEDGDRMHALAAKARDGSLTAEEHEEIRDYERVGNMLAFLKAKARKRLRAADRRNGPAK